MHTIVAVRSDSRVSAECLKDNAMRIEFVAGRGRGRRDHLTLFATRRVASEVHVALSDALGRKIPDPQPGEPKPPTGGVIRKSRNRPDPKPKVEAHK